jgi:hypothetical protein
LPFDKTAGLRVRRELAFGTESFGVRGTNAGFRAENAIQRIDHLGCIRLRFICRKYGLGKQGA